jgi:hypothetical protein
MTVTFPAGRHIGPAEIEQQVQHVEQRLAGDFHGLIPDARVHDEVAAARSALSDARILQFVPTLVERRARRRLVDLTKEGA